MSKQNLLLAINVVCAICALTVYGVEGALHTRTPVFSIAGPIALIGFCGVLLWQRIRPGHYEAQAVTTLSVMALLAVGVMLHASLAYPAVRIFQYRQMLQWAPLVYAAAAVLLSRRATRFSWAIYAVYVSVAALACTRIYRAGVTTEDERRFISALLSLAMSHPVYIIALSYVGDLNRRLLHAQASSLRARASMMAMIGHEIRTPLQAILGSTELLKLTAIKGGAEERAIERIGASSLQLHRRLRDLTLLARLDSGTATVAGEQTFSLVDLVQDVIDEATMAMPRPGMRVVPQVSVHYAVKGDPAALHQVLSNLLTNAIKYGDPASPVAVRAFELPDQPGRIRFEVEDHGPGVAPQLRDTIFQPFVRGAAFDTDGATGSGLGLAVVRRLVELMQGDVAVRTAQPHGAVFTVTLPLPAA